MLERRSSISPAMEDPEDCVVGESAADEEIDNEEAVVLQQQLAVLEPAPDAPYEFRHDLVKLPKEVRNLLAGGIAGMAAKSVVAPLDRIKILYQVSSAEFHLRHVPRVAKNIVNNEGLQALFKGNSATMIRVFPYSGIQFTIYDRCKTYFLRQHEQDRLANAATTAGAIHRKWGLSPWESLLSGMLAGTVSVIATYPLDLTRAQMAVLKRHKHEPNPGFTSVMANNYRTRGTPGLFRGITPTLIGILPYSGIAFALNEQAKREIQHMTNRDLTTPERMQCGAIAGLVAQTLTYPIEVTRRRMQTIGLVGTDTAFTSLGVLGAGGDSGSAKRTAAVDIPLGLMATIRSLYVQQGVRGFFKGVTMNWVKGPIAFSISFTTFDTVQSFMESESERALKRPRHYATQMGKEGE